MPSGKITHRKGLHASRQGGWMEPVNLTEEHLEDIAKIIGRPLQSSEVKAVEEALQTIRHFAKRRESEASSEDSKASLKNIAATADEAKLLLAYSDTDRYTETQLKSALGRLGIKEFRNVEPTLIRKAAQDALDNFPKLTQTKPVEFWRYRFRDSCLRLWAELGRADDAAHRGADDAGTPLVKFAQIMYRAALTKEISASGAVKILKNG